MRRALPLAVAALALAGTSPAGASSFPRVPDWLARSEAKSAAQWRARPCGGDVSYRWAVLPRHLWATSAWLYGRPGDASTFRACTVTFNLAPRYPWDWPTFCTIRTHEDGHLLGHGHDENDLLMGTFYIGPITRCERR